MSQRQEDFTLTLSFDHPPERVYDAINDVAAWWSGEINGRADRVGAQFVYRYKDLHRSTQRVEELVPGARVVWRVLDAALTFVADQGEWAGTTIVFELAARGGKTELRFTHVGLHPARGCYRACASGWTTLLTASLAQRVATGRPQPDALAAVSP